MKQISEEEFNEAVNSTHQMYSYNDLDDCRCDELVEALEEYGNHKVDCIYLTLNWSEGTAQCSCGLTKALAGKE